MLCGKNLTRWPWPLTLKINRVPDFIENKKTWFWLNLMAKSILSHSDCHWFSCHLQLNTKSWVRSDQCFLSFTLKSTSNINSKRHVLVIPSPTKLRRDIVTLPSVHSSVTSWRMLILECSQGCYAVKIWPGDLDLWPWKLIEFQILLKTKKHDFD
jgi:hypothetical protein